MIKIEKEVVFGWEAAVRGMRNSYNSWEKGDSGYGCNSGLCKACGVSPIWCKSTIGYVIGENDLELMKKLSKAGSSHAKFRRMINVTVDITAPLYWWKEFDTYKVGTVALSCSTMHTIADHEFSREDFSAEYLYDDELDCLDFVISYLNGARSLYLAMKRKEYWQSMIHLLPSSYNQKRTVQFNYEVLSAVYRDRKNHKLDEWRDFCSWIEGLPYAEGVVYICKEKSNE